LWIGLQPSFPNNVLNRSNLLIALGMYFLGGEKNYYRIKRFSKLQRYAAHT
jgi:hypothetical protein